ncbi:MAG: cytochrome c3 family protein [Bryobacteraceae bacterium]|jgi:hypothetical protein
MAQIFHHSANDYARMSIILGVCAIGFIAWAGYELDRGSYETRQDEARDQPVPFSHAHHVGALGLDCRYCHTSVEDSSFANIPPTKTCINCHSQIWNTSPTLEPVRASYRTGDSIQWTRVHDLPDFVYFNHGIHVSKGVGCESCHGRVDKMPLMWKANSLEMSWCLDCHRNPQRVLRPRSEITTMGYVPPGDQEELGAQLMHQYNTPDVRVLTSCSTCHR